MYSKKQIEVAEEHGVVLKSIPVLDLLPFDKIFMDTQEVEEVGRVIRYFTPHAVFRCNCHRHVPEYRRRKKIMGTLIDDKGNKYEDNSYSVYVDRIAHHSYCEQLARYRYEEDYNLNDRNVKYAPKKNHLIFTGQTRDLHTITYVFERDEEVLIVEDTGRTTPKPMTITNGQELVDMAEMDEEIENTNRYYDYTFNSWFRSCDRIHDHHDSDRYNYTLPQTTERLFETLDRNLKNFNDTIKDITRIGSDNWNSTDGNNEDARKLYQLRDHMRYIIRSTHYEICDDIGKTNLLYGGDDSTYEHFLNSINLINEIEERLLDTKKESYYANREMDIDDYYYVLFGDKLKRKHEEVV